MPLLIVVERKWINGALKIAQQLEMLASNPDNPSLIPENHMVEGENWSQKLSSDHHILVFVPEGIHIL